MTFGVDPRNPLEYARINYFLVPGVCYNREPVSGIGGDYDFQVETIWRVGRGPDGSPPSSGVEGDQWMLVRKTGSYAQGTQNPTWVKFAWGDFGSLHTLSDQLNVVTEPTNSTEVPPNNIQLYSSNNSVTIESDPSNHRIDFRVAGGGGGGGLERIQTDEGYAEPAGTPSTINLVGGVLPSGQMPAYATADNLNTVTLHVNVATDVLVGVASFDAAQFDVSFDGAVTLKGGTTPSVLELNVDAGTSPVTAGVGGDVTVTCDVVGPGTTPLQTNGTAANTMTIQAQVSQALDAADVTKVGLCNFDDDFFSVDANGFVSFIGSGGGSSGNVVQQLIATSNTPESTTLTLGTAATPSAVNTAPLISQAFTPTNAGNRIKVEFSTFYSATGNADAGFFLFEDSTLITCWVAPEESNFLSGCTANYTFYTTANSTAPRTYEVRFAGVEAPAATTRTLETVTGGTPFGGAVSTQLAISEVVS